jgi:hypothetical protein
MSIVVRYTPTGLTREQYDKVNSILGDLESAPPDGLDMHVCFGEDGDLKVSEIWDSREQLMAFRERLVPALEEAGVALNAEGPDIYEVQNLMERSAAPAA